MYWRVIVQGAVIHHVSPHTEGYRLAVRLLYSDYGMLFTVLPSLLAAGAGAAAQAGPVTCRSASKGLRHRDRPRVVGEVLAVSGVAAVPTLLTELVVAKVWIIPRQGWGYMSTLNFN